MLEVRPAIATEARAEWPFEATAEWRLGHALLLALCLIVVIGNFVVISAVLLDRKLRTVTTNKFIASLAISDLLVGLFVMPLSLYSKVHNDDWHLGYAWCQLHLVTGVFSSTASIVHLVAISLDRYFAIMFPTEYQRHSVSTSTLPYVVMIWLMALAVSSTLLMEKQHTDGRICWIHNPQYIVLSSLLSFFLPGAIVVYMYVKIFKKLRNHQLYMFGHGGTSGRTEKRRRSLPRVIIEEVRSRRGSRLSQTGSQSGSPTRRSSGGSGGCSGTASSHKNERSPSQPEIHSIKLPQQRWRSPTICAETFEHDRKAAAKKRVSIVPDPPSMDISSCGSMSGLRAEHEAAREREAEMQSQTAAGSSTVSKASRRNEDDMAGAETLRKLSEERRLRREERRKLSMDGSPNGVPLMAAFDKAFAEVTQERRRSSCSFDVLEETSLRTPPLAVPHHASLRPTLSTVCDDDAAELAAARNDEEEEASKPLLGQSFSAPANCSPSSAPSTAPPPAPVSSASSSALCPLLSVPAPAVRRGSNRPNFSFISNGKVPASGSKGGLGCAGRIPPPTFLMVPAIMSINTPPLSPAMIMAASSSSSAPSAQPNNNHAVAATPNTLKVPRLFEVPSPCCEIPPSNSSHSSYTSASGSSETYRRISMNSFGSSLTDQTDSTYEIDSRRSSAWSTLRAAVLAEPHRGKKSLVDINIERSPGSGGGPGSPVKKTSAISRGKLRRIATQVTRAIRRKRRESLAIRRESRATRVVAAILLAFLACWLPYYVVLVYRGVMTGSGFGVDVPLHHKLFILTSWLGYAHSAFNPVIYMCLNKNFRHTMRRLLARRRNDRPITA